MVCFGHWFFINCFLLFGWDFLASCSQLWADIMLQVGMIGHCLPFHDFDISGKTSSVFWTAETCRNLLPSLETGLHSLRTLWKDSCSLLQKQKLKNDAVVSLPLNYSKESVWSLESSPVGFLFGWKRETRVLRFNDIKSPTALGIWLAIWRLNVSQFACVSGIGVSTKHTQCLEE